MQVGIKMKRKPIHTNERLFVLVILLLLNVSTVFSQLLSPEATELDSAIMQHIESHLIVPAKEEIAGSKWTYIDVMGNSELSFYNQKFQFKNNGVNGKYSKSKGSWYIHDKYVVIEVKNEKEPLFHLSYNGKIILLDQSKIDMMRTLILSLAAKGELVGELDDDTIFSFLNGFERNDK